MKQHQQGSALIVAIFMVVVSALVAVSLLFSERVMVNKVMFIKNYDQAYAILQGPQLGSASVIDEQSKYNIKI